MKLKPSFPRLRRDHPLANGLVGAWIMTEGSGSRLRNATGNQRLDATTVNVPQWSAGPRGSVFGGNGTGHAVVPHSYELDLTELTISAYIMRTGTPSANDTVIGREVSTSPTNVPYRFVYTNDSTVRFGFNAASELSVNETGGIANGANNNEWFFYQLRILSAGSGSNVAIFRDGQFVANSNSPSLVPPIRVSPLFLGAENNRRFFPGKIGAVWLHNRPLISGTGEIAEMADDPFAMFRPRQRSYFAFFAGGAPPDPPTAPRRRQQPQLIGCGVI